MGKSIPIYHPRTFFFSSRVGKFEIFKVRYISLVSEVSIC